MMKTRGECPYNRRAWEMRTLIVLNVLHPSLTHSHERIPPIPNEGVAEMGTTFCEVERR